MSTVRLRPAQARTFNGALRYHVVYDYAAGSRNRYTVMIPTSGDPVVIGRELDLRSARDLIRDYEYAASKILWFGDRRTIQSLVKKVSNLRKLNHER